MRRETITFRLDANQKRALDAIAAGLDRDRSYVLNEAVRSYLEVYRWQMEHIQEGLRQAEAGELVADSDVKHAFSRRRKRR